MAIPSSMDGILSQPAANRLRETVMVLLDQRQEPPTSGLAPIPELADQIFLQHPPSVNLHTSKHHDPTGNQCNPHRRHESLPAVEAVAQKRYSPLHPHPHPLLN